MAGVAGTVRFAQRDGDVASLREDDIAVVDLPELDARQAQALIDRRVRAVLNVAASSSGRVPNVGPQMLSRAGILLIDLAGDDAWSKLKNGESVRIEDGKVFRDEILVVSGTELDETRTSAALADAESGLATRLDSLAANASDHIQREQTMLLDGAHVPRTRTNLRGRAVVVVSRAYDDEADLRGLRRYIRDDDPVLIGAGAGADVLLKAGYVPAVVVGALDHLSDAAIRAAGEVVVTTSSGTVDTPERLERHGKEVVTFVSTGSDDDLAILLADTNEAEVIVHVGAPATLSKFLERPPSEVARMFVARLRAGSKIVDAKAVNHFTSQRFPLWPVMLLLAAGVVAVAVSIAVTPVGNDWFDSLGDQLADLGTWIKGLFS
ncbi:putative cytokinetic ring protein SteA [Aeromicrobium sp.]|uniref:putative cytokinetic ring protein SteA n=1 Tax=Aeromicrobium sp. TaxID=1871063 RepID=UPI002FCAB03F